MSHSIHNENAPTFIDLKLQPDSENAFRFLSFKNWLGHGCFLPRGSSCSAVLIGVQLQPAASPLKVCIPNPPTSAKVKHLSERGLQFWKTRKAIATVDLDFKPSTRLCFKKIQTQFLTLNWVERPQKLCSPRSSSQEYLAQLLRSWCDLRQPSLPTPSTQSNASWASKNNDNNSGPRRPAWIKSLLG